MNESIRSICNLLRDHGLNHFGFCPFSAVADKLIPGHSQQRLPAAPRTILSFLFPLRLPDFPASNVARFAALPDYHAVVQSALRPAAESLSARFPAYAFVSFCDASPLPEVRAAAHAGLGIIGRHNLLIHETFGSWAVLGEIVTDLPLPVDARPLRFCEACGKCRQSCPAGALDEIPFDRRRCLSHITQSKETPTPAQAALMRREGIAWGCDRCQEACPMNEGRTCSDVSAFYEQVHPIITPQSLPNLTGRVFLWKGTALIARNLRIIGGEEENTSGEWQETAPSEKPNLKEQ